jgi:hypothetical protein
MQLESGWSFTMEAAAYECLQVALLVSILGPLLLFLHPSVLWTKGTTCCTSLCPIRCKASIETGLILSGQQFIAGQLWFLQQFTSAIRFLPPSIEDHFHKLIVLARPFLTQCGSRSKIVEISLGLQLWNQRRFSSDHWSSTSVTLVDEVASSVQLER